MTEEKSPLAKKEEEILKFWQDNKIFELSLSRPAPRGEFVFYEGPPYANGLPGIHHLEARAFKDVILRYRTMRGFNVSRRAGWDTHGLPIEMAVEKKLGLTSKKEIEEKVGIDKFAAAAKENVFFYKAEWEKFTRRIGYWLDFENAYLTMSVDYMESVWWIIKQTFEQGLLYKDYKVLPWCPRCGTALSSHELAQGYEEVENLGVTVKFKVKNPEQHNLPVNTFLLAWTTTPWTLPGNVALAVGEKIEYVLFQNGDDWLIASPELVLPRSSDLLASGSARPLAKQVPASQLVGLEYEPLFNFPELQNEQSHRVYAADFVTTTEGTGIVHTAVMYGQDDFELGAKHNLPKHHLVGEDGKFIGGTPWAGKFVKDVDIVIIADLKKRGLLFKQETVRHTYPFCWRCQTPLIYYARDSWYLKMSVLREELLTANEKINWRPAHIKDGRFGEWLREVKDWAISRERYWGTPLPVWQSADGKERVVIGSIEELKRYTKKSGNRYFVMRHGEAENNKLNILSSRAENPHHLTERGMAAVRQATEKLRTEKIDLIVSSDFIRARETAETVAEVLGLSKTKIKYDVRLREVDHGDFNGRPTSASRDYFKTFKTDEECFTKGYPGGENFAEVKRRMGEALYELEKNYQGQTILIVTHESPSWLLFAAARGADLPTTIAIRGSEPDFLKNAEVRPLDFTPLPHNADYELDLHRPFIDEMELIGESGATLKRIPEVLDVWFDSGAMPFAQDHYPFAKKEILYPADFIAEAIDQTRGWFYTLLAVAVLLKRGSPYKNVICLGHILDRDGKKMSKSVGNVVDPRLAMDKYGVDALRFWMYVVNAPGESKNFDEAGVTEVVRKIVNPLMNVLAFYELYRGSVLPSDVAAPAHVLDQWLAVYQDELVRQMTDYLENYQITEAARLIREFVADLSQWYLRRSRERIKSGDAAALAALRDALFNLARLAAPFMPFLAEVIYQKLRTVADPESVHLTDWPLPKKLQAAGCKLLEDMLGVRRLVSLGLETRDKSGIKVRQPLSRLTFRGEDKFNPALTDLIKAEVNVREVVWQTVLPAAAVLDTVVTPELKLAGDLREIIRQIQDLRKRSGLRPGEPAVLVVAARHPARTLFETEAANLTRAASLTKIEFNDTTDVPLTLSH